MSDEKNTQQDQQNNAGKEHKKFEANFKKMVALFSGGTIFKKTKLVSEEINTAVAELVKEEKEALIKTFKEKAKQLINRKQAFDAFKVEEQKKMDKAIAEKEKEFNKEMEGAFALVDKIETIEKSYYNTLKDLSTSPENEEVVANTEEGATEE